jgi:nitroimidazol reductase NimA-like FMN-containing flavoprotein (pyridoxamine 5'-phosphate oxidase superfamily)
MRTTKPRAQPLEPADCYLLLATSCVGRLVSTDNALPMVLPVNYCLDGRSIVFRTSPDGRLAAATHNVVVAFEVDSIDVETWTGWSVVVTGVASPLTSPGDVVRAGQLGLANWLGEDRDHFVQIVPGLVTGRRPHVAPAAAGP